MFQTRQRLIGSVAALLCMAQPVHADWADDVNQINSLTQQGKYPEAQHFASESLARGPGGLLFAGTGALIIRHQRASIRLLLGDIAGAIEDADVIVRANSDLLTAEAGYAIRRKPSFSPVVKLSRRVRLPPSLPRRASLRTS